MQRNKLFRDFRHLSRLVDDGTELTAFDTETTGLYPATDRVIEIGAVKFKGSQIIDRYNVLINPGFTIPAKVTSINHIDNAMVRSCPAIQSVLPVFLDFIGSSVLIAHNANFDLDFINGELQRNRLHPVRNMAIDTLELSRWAYPRLGKHNLQFLAKAFSIDVHDAHRASDDARVCMEIFLRCMRDTESVRTASV